MVHLLCHSVELVVRDRTNKARPGRGLGTYAPPLLLAGLLFNRAPTARPRATAPPPRYCAPTALLRSHRASPRYCAPSLQTDRSQRAGGGQASQLVGCEETSKPTCSFLFNLDFVEDI